VGIQVVWVTVIPIVYIAVFLFVGQAISVRALAIVKEFVEPTNKAGPHSWAELVQCVALTGDMIGFPVQHAPLSGTITTVQVLSFFILALVNPC
jgi:hypothetical protein